MDLTPLRALVRKVNFATHGVDALVRVPGDPPVATRIIWLASITEPRPAGSQFGRAEPRRILAIRRDDVEAVPLGTRVEVTEHLLDKPSIWVVDSVETISSDHHRLVVLPES